MRDSLGSARMMDTLAAKHETIRVLVADVLRRLPEADLIVMDWWKADPYAICIALHSNPGRLAYVSRPPEFRGLYFLSCEFAAKHDVEPHHNIEADYYSDLTVLATHIAEHLGAA
jgi:hypothetical protein